MQIKESEINRHAAVIATIAGSQEKDEKESAAPKKIASYLNSIISQVSVDKKELQLTILKKAQESLEGNNKGLEIINSAIIAVDNDRPIFSMTKAADVANNRSPNKTVFTRV